MDHSIIENEQESFESYTEAGIKNILNQLQKLLSDQGEGIEGICFLKNRNIILQSTPIAYVVETAGSSDEIHRCKGKELFYADFPKWREDLNNIEYIEDLIPTHQIGPFDFSESKSVIVVPIKTTHYFWGTVVCFQSGNRTWKDSSIELIVSLSELIKTQMIYYHKHMKVVHQVNSLKGQLKLKDQLIKSLQKNVKKKNERLKHLFEEKEEAKFKWTGTDDKYDEIWLTLHGFKNDNPEPVVSKWEKINTKSVLDKIYDSFFSDKNVEIKA